MALISGKTAFVLAGGGSLGSIQVGMLRAIVAAGVVPDFIVGSSVGAVNASYFAACPDAQGVERLAEIWLGLRRADIFPFTWATAVGLFRHPNNLVDPAGLRRVIESNLPYARLEDAALPVHVVATDAQGLDVCISRGPAVEAILASAAIPGVFPPVWIDGRALMDGAIAANTPIGVAARLGASRIVVLPTGFACALKEPPQGAMAKALHAITLLISAQLMHELDRLPPEITAHVAPILCPLDVSPFDFAASGELIDRAARSTCAWIADGGLTRRSCASELAPHPH
jgi:NTE family protein